MNNGYVNKRMNRRNFLAGSGRVLGGASMLGLAGCAQQMINYDKLEYMSQKFMEYADEIGKRYVDKYWREGKPVEWACSLIRQIFAGTNDLIEWPVTGAGELVAGLICGEECKIGARKAVRGIFDSIAGGEGNDELNEYLWRGDIKGACEYARAREDSEFDAASRTIVTGASDGAFIHGVVQTFEACLHDGGTGGAAAATGRPGPTGPLQ